MPDDAPASFDFAGMALLTKSNDEEPSDEDLPVKQGLQRAELIESVQQGKRTPNEVDQLLKSNGFKPVTFTPERQEMVFWSPEMVAAAITTRNETEVFRHYSKAWETARGWARNSNIYNMTNKTTRRATKFELLLPYERCGYDAVELGETFLFSEYVDFAGQWRTFPKTDEWFPGLKDALCHGEITAAGLSRGRTDIIEPVQWHNATFVRSRDSKSTRLSIGDRLTYSKIQFYPSDFIRKYIPNIKFGITNHKDVLQSKVTGYVPWKDNIDKEKLTNKQRALFTVVNEKFDRRGFPKFWTNRLRYEVLLSILTDSVFEKWQPGDSTTFDRWVLDAQQRLCKPTHES